MHHEINYKWPNGKDETRTIDFIQYGDVNGYTAMAKTVGLPCAIAAKMVLESKETAIYLKIDLSLFKKNYIVEEIQTPGMVLPLSRDIYKPMLNRLNAEGLTWTDTTKQNN